MSFIGTVRMGRRQDPNPVPPLPQSTVHGRERSRVSFGAGGWQGVRSVDVLS